MFIITIIILKKSLEVLNVKLQLSDDNGLELIIKN